MLLPYQETIKQFKIVLASSSKSRKQKLENIDTLQFEIFPSNFEENLDKSLFKTPQDYVRATCQGKVSEVLTRIQPQDWDILIFADTVCDLNGRVIEKPRSKLQAIEYLQEFKDKWHSVHTCVHLIGKRKKDNKILEEEFIETTEVLMGSLTQEAIEAYCDQEELWQDKAGGYAIQGRGSPMIKQLKGFLQMIIFRCHNNIGGLPLYSLSLEMCKLLEFLKQD